MGADGFMPQISTGQIFSRVVALVSSMIKESTHLKGIIQQNVNIVIKSFLKIRKLNLTKNKVIQNSETEIEKMFNELHSQRDEEKANFILQCIKLIESGDCDS
jgi:Mg2+/Co2+ transporter CorB